MSMTEVFEGYRLSPQQQRVLSLYQANGNAGYGAWMVLRLTGTLDVEALEGAVKLVVRKNEILRTQFHPTQDRIFLQVIKEDSPCWRFECENNNSGSLPAFLGWDSLRILARPVVFESEPLFRALLKKIGVNEHLLCLSAASVVADSVTIGLVAEQIEEVYLATLARRQAPAQGLQYAEIAEWFNNVLESPDSEQGRRYWRLQTESLDPSSMKLPLEYPVGAVRRFRAKYVSSDIDCELRQSLRELAASLGARLEDLLLGCWFILLFRMCQKSDITVGSRFRGRALEELKEGIGLFARQLPITVNLGGDSSLARIVSEVAVKTAEASRHQDSFDWSDAMEKAGSNGGCLLPVQFSFESVRPARQRSGVTFSVVDSLAVIERFKIALTCYSGPDDALSARFFYDASILEKDSVRLVSERFVSLLKRIVRNPELKVEQLEVVGPRERRKLIAGLNRTKTAEACDFIVPDAVRRQAQRTPDTIALRYGDEAVTYRTLDAASNRLGNYLRRSEVRPEVRVAILLPRSIDMMISILGVWKAGGAFVPLDPAFPPDRLRFIIENAGASLLITNAEGAGRLTDIPCRALRLDDERAEIESQRDTPPNAGTDPANLAYLIYTSGSTGTPKGIAIEHRSLANYVRSVTAALDLPRSANYALISTVAADLGNTMIYPSLCNGGTLHLVNDNCSTDPEAWAEYADTHGIDCLKIVPSHFQLLLEASRSQRVCPRQRLVLGGEACDWNLVERVGSLAPDCLVFNHYGPTETTVGVLTEPLAPAATSRGSGAPSLGRPVAGSRVFILDPQGELVPMCCPGELHIGGQSLARGYVDQPAITAARFIPDTFGDQPGERLYRTGDRVSHLYDGRIEFHGRTDNQVKIHGYRVELEEIEALLRRHSDVSAAKVIIDSHSRQDEFATWLKGVVRQPAGIATEHRPTQRLSAYLTPLKDRTIEITGVKSMLARELPDYCIPSEFFILDRLPLNQNGKVDLNALRELKQEAEQPRNLVNPKTAVQSQLLEIWCEILERRDIGTTDNFFEVGGDSFLAIRMMARIQKSFGQRLPLAILISTATVEQIAELLSSGQKCEPQHLVAIRSEGDLPPLYCVHPGHGSVLCYQALSRRLGPAQPVFGLQALDFLYFHEGAAPVASIGEIAARHVSAIAQAQPPGESFSLAGWSFGGMVAFEMARQLEQQGNRPAHLFLFDCRLPITAAAISSVDPKLMKTGILFDYGGREISRHFSLEELVHLTVEEQLQLVAQRTGLNVSDLVPEGIERDRLDSYLAMRSARIDALRLYRFQPYGGKITLFRAEDSGSSTKILELQQAFEEAAQTADYGWTNLGLGGLDVITVPGTHDSLLSEPHVELLARELTHCLAHRPAARAAN